MAKLANFLIKFTEKRSTQQRPSTTLKICEKVDLKSFSHRFDENKILQEKICNFHIVKLMTSIFMI